MAVATYEDVEVALGRPISTDAEQAQVEWWLEGVELVVSTRLGDIDALSEAALKFVEVEAVAAKVGRSTSGGASSITVNVDDAGVTRRFENPVTADDITDLWWTLLGSPRARGGSMTVSGGWMLRR